MDRVRAGREGKAREGSFIASNKVRPHLRTHSLERLRHPRRGLAINSNEVKAAFPPRIGEDQGFKEGREQMRSLMRPLAAWAIPTPPFFWFKPRQEREARG